MHERDKRYGKHLIRRNIDTHNFIHPQALPHTPTTSLRNFAGYTHIWVIPCEKSEKNMSDFFWIFDLKSQKYKLF